MKERTAENILATKKWAKVSAWSVAAVLLVMVVLGIYFSREPDIFWVNRSASSESETAIVGLSTTDTLIRVAETLLDKQGGYLTNDKIPPSVFLDNIPSWEFGVVIQVRDLGRVMRDDYTRAVSRSPRKTKTSPPAHRGSSSTTIPGYSRLPSRNTGTASSRLSIIGNA